MPCPLDRGRKLPLMLCAVTRYPPGKYLSALGDILSEEPYILVINSLILSAEYAYLFPSAHSSSSLHRRISSVIITLWSVISHYQVLQNPVMLLPYS